MKVFGDDFSFITNFIFALQTEDKLYRPIIFLCFINRKLDEFPIYKAKD